MASPPNIPAGAVLGRGRGSAPAPSGAGCSLTPLEAHDTATALGLQLLEGLPVGLEWLQGAWVLAESKPKGDDVLFHSGQVTS